MNGGNRQTKEIDNTERKKKERMTLLQLRGLTRIIQDDPISTLSLDSDEHHSSSFLPTRGRAIEILGIRREIRTTEDTQSHLALHDQPQSHCVLLFSDVSLRTIDRVQDPETTFPTTWIIPFLFVVQNDGKELTQERRTKKSQPSKSKFRVERENEEEGRMDFWVMVWNLEKRKEKGERKEKERGRGERRRDFPSTPQHETEHQIEINFFKTHSSVPWSIAVRISSSELGCLPSLT